MQTSRRLWRLAVIYYVMASAAEPHAKPAFLFAAR